MRAYQLRRLLNGAASGGGGGSSAIDRMQGYASNLMSENYYSGNSSRANLVIGNGAEGFDNGGIYHDADLWLHNVPAGGGTNFVRRILFGLNSITGYVQPGNYRISAESGWICTAVNGGASSFMHITQQGIESATPGLRDALFTIDDLGTNGSYAGLILNALVRTVSSGGPFDCKKLYVGLDSNYSAWLIGNICDAAWKSNFNGVAALKSADMNGMNNNQRSVQFAFLPEHLISPTRSYQGTQSVSYGEYAKICKEVNCINWMVLPTGQEQWFFGCSVAGNHVTRTYPGDGRYENIPSWNVGDEIALGGGDFQSGAATSWGPKGAQKYTIRTKIDENTFTLTDTLTGLEVVIGADYAPGNYSGFMYRLHSIYALAKAAFQQAFDANPTGIVCPQSGLENWNFTYDYEFNRQIASVQAGQPFNAGRGYGWRTLQMWKAMLEVFPRNQCIFILDSWGYGEIAFDTLSQALNQVSDDPSFFPGKTLSEIAGDDLMFSCADYPHFAATSGGDQIGIFEIMAAVGTNPTPAQWSFYSRNAIDERHVRSTAWRAKLDLVRPHTKSIMYEGGPSTEGMFYQGFDAANQNVTGVNVGTPGSLTTAPFNGGSGTWPANWPVEFTSTGTLPGGLTGGYKWVHPSSTNTNLVVSATQGGAPMAITTAGSGTIRANCGTGQHIVDLGSSYAAYAASTECAADFEYFLQRVVRDGFKAKAFAVYSQCAGWGRGNSYMSFWGLKRAAQLPDTPVVTKMKTYTDYGVVT